MIDQFHARWTRSVLASAVVAGLAACGGGGDTAAPTAASADNSAAGKPAAAASASSPISASEKFLDFQVSAQVAQPFAAGNLTLDAGIVKIGDRFFVSDHASGFCPLVKKGGDTLYTIDGDGCITAATSPGQSAQQRLTDGSYFAYIADNSARGVAIYRVHLDNNGRLDPNYLIEALAPSVPGAPTFWSDRPRVTAITFGPDGHLYAVFGRNNAVLRIQNPHGVKTDPSGVPIPPRSNDDLTVPTADIVGRTIDKVGPPSITFVNDDLYLAEAAGVSVIKGLANQLVGPVPEKTAVSLHPTYINIPAPMVVASIDGRNLFIGDSGNLYRYDTRGDANGLCNQVAGDPTSGGGRLEILAKGGNDGHDFRNIGGIGISWNGSGSPTELMVADDRTLGDVFNEGRVFRVADAANAPADRPAATCADNQSAPPVETEKGVVRGTEMGGVTYGSVTDLTSPSAILQLGATTWVVDHVLGLCRVDKMSTNADRVEFCNLDAASPSHAVYDSTKNAVYVTDMSSGRGAVVRLTYNAATGKVGNPVRLTNTTFRDNSPMALALEVDKSGATSGLFVAMRRNNQIYKVPNPSTAASALPANLAAVGRVAKKVPASMAYAAGTLYLAEPAGVTKMDFTTCRQPCTAVSAGLPYAAPAYIASHGQLVDDKGRRTLDSNSAKFYVLYVSEGNALHRSFIPDFKVQVGSSQMNYVTEAKQQSAGADVNIPLQFTGAIGIDATKKLTSDEPVSSDRFFLSDDPSNGGNNRARIWELEQE